MGYISLVGYRSLAGRRIQPLYNPPRSRQEVPLSARRTTVETRLLTALAVAKYRGRPGVRRVIRDLGARGLFLIVHASGAKSWQMIFRSAGAGKSGRVTMTIGPVDLSGKELDGDPVVGAPLTLAAARSLAAEIHRQR